MNGFSTTQSLSLFQRKHEQQRIMYSDWQQNGKSLPLKQSLSPNISFQKIWGGFGYIYLLYIYIYVFFYHVSLLPWQTQIGYILRFSLNDKVSNYIYLDTFGVFQPFCNSLSKASSYYNMGIPPPPSTKSSAERRKGLDPACTEP